MIGISSVPLGRNSGKGLVSCAGNRLTIDSAVPQGTDGRYAICFLVVMAVLVRARVEGMASAGLQVCRQDAGATGGLEVWVKVRSGPAGRPPSNSHRSVMGRA